MKKQCIAIGVFTLTCLLAMNVSAADWPSWRGVNQDGIVQEPAVKVAADPNVLWEENVGFGFSGVTVVDGKLYTHGWFNREDHVRCLDAKTGKEIWKYSYKCKRLNKFHTGGPGATPTVHEGRVYTVSKEGHVHILDAKSGSLLFGENLAEEHGSDIPTWGFSGSVTIEGDMALIDLGIILALDRKTGKLLWKSAKMPAGYGTPVAFTKGDRRLVSSFNADGCVIVDAKNGKTIASYPWKTQHDVNASLPMISADGSQIFLSSGYDRGATLLSFDGSKLTKVWENKKMRNQMNPCVMIDGYLYGFDGNAGNADLTCMEWATGKVMWRDGGFGAGALIANRPEGSDVTQLIALSEDGDLAIVEATADAYKPISRANVLSKICWTVPTLSNGMIYVRNDKGTLLCIEAR